MAKRKTGLGSAKRFGTRYGPRIKLKLAKIEQEHKKPQECPFCAKKRVKKLALGIWKCRKCSAKFAGKAYTIKKKLVLEEGEQEE